MSTPVTVRFRRPERSELALRQQWATDPTTMAYNVGWGPASPAYDPATGCIHLSLAEWGEWYDAWAPEPPADRQYWLAEDASTGEVVGHAHRRVSTDDTGRRVADIGFLVLPPHQGRGYGAAVLTELLRRIWADTDAAVVRNEFELERTPTRLLHERAGFTARPSGFVDPSGAGRTVMLWELTRS